MLSLFLDTSHSIVAGIWKDGQWLAYETEQGLASKDLHWRVNQMLSQLGLEISDLDDLLAIVGPGSYTGVRVAKGVADILSWQGIKLYSLRHFDVAAMAGETKGTFVSNAFKNELFVYEWNEQESWNSLIGQPEWETKRNELREKSIKIFTSQPDLFSDAISTHELIRSRAQMLFPLVKSQNLNHDIFYYRNLENEFKKA